MATKKQQLPTPPANLIQPIEAKVVGGEPDPLEDVVQRTRPYISQDVINSVILNGDLSKLSQSDLTSYYVYRCQSMGLDPASKPFDVLTLQGKKVLYANKACAAQLRAIHKISTAITEEREWNGLLIVKTRAWYPDGRQHEDEGYAKIEGLSGDMLGNARLKAVTKATRRTVLHLCGLGELDESEVETIPNARTSAFADAKNILIPKQNPTGSDVVQVMEIRGADDTNDTVEVLDANNRTWYFQGKDAQNVAFEAVKKQDSVFVDYTVISGKYIVNVARL
jgi:hypothetical protein